MKVSVSILKEKNNIEKVISKLNDTDCDFIHLDIMDKTFTESSSFELSYFKNINTNKKYDIHIMSTNLEYQINEAIKLNPEYITIHYEASNDISKYIKIIKDNNIKAGLAISPNTNYADIVDLLSNIDLLLVMSVEPGKGGQEFIMDTISKLEEINSNNHKFIISVDGGINKNTIEYVNNYVDMVVSGSFITSSINYQKSIDVLKM